MAGAFGLNSCKALFLRRLPLALAAALCLCAVGLPAEAQELRVSQPNAARFPQVAVYAYPIDSRGVLVPGLKANDFSITENGLPAKIESVTSGGTTLDIALALDCSKSMLD